MGIQAFFCEAQASRDWTKSCNNWVLSCWVHLLGVCCVLCGVVEGLSPLAFFVVEPLLRALDRKPLNGPDAQSGHGLLLGLDGGPQLYELSLMSTLVTTKAPLVALPS